MTLRGYTGYTFGAMAKVLISVPDEKLKRIDALARAEGKTRSAYVVEHALAPAAPRYARPIDDPKVRKALEGIARARTEKWKPGPDTLTIIREQREHSYSRLTGR